MNTYEKVFNELLECDWFSNCGIESNTSYNFDILA